MEAKTNFSCCTFEEKLSKSQQPSHKVFAQELAQEAQILIDENMTRKSVKDEAKVSSEYVYNLICSHFSSFEFASYNKMDDYSDYSLEVYYNTLCEIDMWITEGLRFVKNVIKRTFGSYPNTPEAIDWISSLYELHVDITDERLSCHTTLYSRGINVEYKDEVQTKLYKILDFFHIRLYDC